jgi:8-oxo-dGTP diphosphatase
MDLKKSVAGIAFESDKFFIARRKSGGDLGGKWEFPGGKVEEGESDEEALKREYLEELGVSVETGPCLGNALFEHKGKNFSVNAYRIFFTDTHFTLHEHTEWRWASLSEIGELDFADSDRKLLSALESDLNK